MVNEAILRLNPLLKKITILWYTGGCDRREIFEFDVKETRHHFLNEEPMQSKKYAQFNLAVKYKGLIE